MLPVKDSVDGRDRTHVPTLALHEIQATVLRQRPAPYFGTHVFLRVDDAAAGRELLHARAEDVVDPSPQSHDDFQVLAAGARVQCPAGASAPRRQRPQLPR